MDFRVLDYLRSAFGIINSLREIYETHPSDASEELESFFQSAVILHFLQLLVEFPDRFHDEMARFFPPEIIVFAESWGIPVGERTNEPADLEKLKNHLDAQFSALGLDVESDELVFDNYLSGAGRFLDRVGFLLTTFPDDREWFYDFVHSLPKDDPLCFLVHYYFRSYLDVNEFQVRNPIRSISFLTRRAVTELMVLDSLFNDIAHVLHASNPDDIEAVLDPLEDEDPFEDLRDKLSESEDLVPLYLLKGVLEVLLYVEDGQLKVHKKRIKTFMKRVENYLLTDDPDEFDEPEEGDSNHLLGNIVLS